MNNNNRGNNNRRRGRGPNRPQGGGQQLNRIDSRARGNAPQMLEKYRKLASDAHLNGDRVQAEYYLQFADHYFRVIADTRVRQEEQRGRAPGERWQGDADGEDDAMDFGPENDFPSFDRQPARRDEPRQQDNRPFEPRQQESRNPENRHSENRQGEPRRDDNRERGDRDQRPPRRDRPARFERPERTESQDRVPAEAERQPFQPDQGSEGESMAEAATPNPFVAEPRGTRGLRPRGERRARRDEPEGFDATAAEAAPALDPSILPPAIGVRSDDARDDSPGPDVATIDDAPAAPRRRGRPRKNPLPAPDAPTEALNG